MDATLNKNSLDTLCGALAYAMGIEPPEHAAPASPELCAYIDEKLGGKKADRVMMYNPDAIPQWIFEKYPSFFKEATARTELQLPLRTVMPSVTPVSFGTMYTGAQPAVHGIQKYAKPVIKIDTLFDALIRAGKKVAIISQGKCSMSMIFLERDMDYHIFATVDESNAKAVEAILKDEYDFLVVYNTNYDAVMHKTGPESKEALGELRCNVRTFAMLSDLIKTHWAHHNTLVGFGMDHGCHEIDENCGSHGLDMPEDLNIMHLYKVYPAKTENE